MSITIAATLSCCNGDDIEKKIEYSFLFAENPVMVGASGGEISTMIISDIAYTPVSLDSWITDVKAESSELVSFKVEANTTDTARDGKICFYIEGTDDTQELTVRQAAATGGLSIDRTSVTFETAGSEEEIKVNSQAGWEVTSTSEWITATKRNASSLILNAGVNLEGKELTGKVVISTAKEDVTIEVRQKNDNSLFNGATTRMGRRFVYNTGDLVTRVTADRSYSVTEGVEVLEIKYMSRHTGSELPYYVYIFEVDLTKKVTLLATCKDDDVSNIKKTSDEVTQTQTVREQFAALKAKRSSLILYGGVNGDFCYGEGSSVEKNGLLHGVMHKDGVCLKETFDGGSACTVFAMMKDGSARIIKQSAYNNYKADILEAVGGRQIIMDAGIITTVKNGKQDPRTAVGVSADRSKVILMVIDGRRSTHSNGADYPEMGRMFKAMGAYNAINLDGGGSSTFAVADNSDPTGTIVKNMPSDNKERAIPNGLAIVSK